MRKSRDSIETAKTELEIEEEIQAHKKGWAVQRAGMIFIFTFLLAAAAGLFGNGAASKNRISGGNITIESERFFRFQASMPITIQVTSAQSQGTTVTFPNHYLQNFEVKSIVPEPKENRFNNGGVTYLFEGSGSMDITFYLSPEKQGSVEGTVIINGSPFPLKHFIYP
jgi:hypothetical protein